MFEACISLADTSCTNDSNPIGTFQWHAVWNVRTGHSGQWLASVRYFQSTILYCITFIYSWPSSADVSGSSHARTGIVFVLYVSKLLFHSCFLKFVSFLSMMQITSDFQFVFLFNWCTIGFIICCGHEACEHMLYLHVTTSGQSITSRTFSLRTNRKTKSSKTKLQWINQSNTTLLAIKH